MVAITPLLLMEFLSVRAAAERVGKSTSSIRRLLYPIIKQDDHPDRDLVRPSVADAMRLRMSGENFPWQVSEELLKRVTVAGNNTDHSPAPSTGKLGGNGESELLPMLRSELDIKNKQISGISELLGKQVERVSGLSDRLREGNVLIAALQQRLALTDGREAKPTSFADAQSTPEPPEESVAPDAKSTGTASPKKGFFGRFFGRAS